MSVTVVLPRPLWTLTGGQTSVQVEDCTAGEVLDALVRRFPALRPHLFDNGNLRQTVGLYLGEYHLERGLDTPTPEGSVFTVVPVIAGGIRRIGPAASGSRPGSARSSRP